jgi:hypothetical protein
MRFDFLFNDLKRDVDVCNTCSSRQFHSKQCGHWPCHFEE